LVAICAKLAVGEFVVADDVDLADLRLRPLGDLEDDVDAVLLELDDLRLDPGGEAALAAVELDDPGDVGARLGAGEDLARRELDLGVDLLVLEPLVALEDDAVDDRVLADLDDDVAGIAAEDLDVGEQLGVVEVADRLIELLAVVGLADPKLHVGEDGLGLEPLVARYGQGVDRAGAGQRRRRQLHRGRRRSGGGLGLRGSRRGLGPPGRRESAEHGADEKRRAQPAAIGSPILGITRPRPCKSLAGTAAPVDSLSSAALPDHRHPIKPPSFAQRPKDAKSFKVTKIISASRAARPVGTPIPGRSGFKGSRRTASIA
jgi:hypothetical protein